MVLKILSSTASRTVSSPQRPATCAVKYTKAKPDSDGEVPRVEIDPRLGYQNHVGADRRYRLIRRWTATDAAAHACARLGEILDPTNTAAGVWADSGYRSKKNETLLAGRLLVSHIHRKKPRGRPMPAHIARANGKRSAIRAPAEHIFASATSSPRAATRPSSPASRGSRRTR